MKDHPILFTPAMVRAILREVEAPGTGKSQTRRLLKVQAPYLATSAGVYSNSVDGWTDKWTWLSGDPRDCDTWDCLGDFSTGYTIGDKLWVRERYFQIGHWEPDPVLTTKTGRTKFRFVADGSPEYVVPDHFEAGFSQSNAQRILKYQRLGRFMPRQYSRLTLTITDVRVERLRDISTADVLEEGAPLDPNHRDCTIDGSNPFMCIVEGRPHTQSPHAWFHRLWDGINGKREGASWAANPWVVAISFTPELRNIDR